MTIWRGFVLVLFGLAFAAPGLAAQGERDSARLGRSGQTAPESQETRPAAPAWPQQPAGTALDRPVSRSEYRLGPGDVLAVSLFGEVAEQYTVPVTPEGAAVVPTIGVTRVLGLNLDQAEERVRALVGRFYRDIEVRVTLLEIRTFKVFVVGQLGERGVRVVSSATRVSEILPVAQGGPGVRRRNVVLRRASGDTVRLDVSRFYQTGDLTHNPVLLAGDVVVIPVLNQTIQVFGRVAFPEQYEFRPGESLAEFLEVANGSGPFPANAADTVRIDRFTQTGSRETVVMTRGEAMGARGRGLLLRPFDAVFVPEVSNFRIHRTAVVRGQVRFPGTYPIRPDTTTVRELVALAGGFTPEASLTNATLRRTPNRAPGPVREFLNAPDSALSREEREIRSITQEAEGATFVVVDFQRLFREGAEAYNQPLQAGDELVVPRHRSEVTVLGAVLRPGVVAYRHGATYLDYVALAGGYTRRADRGDVSLIRAGQGNRVGARDVYYPAPGDQLVVPYRERRTFLERVQGVSAVAGTISSAIVTILALTRIF
jgi:protein involved in polysaccharide export with SLBB domain